MCCSFAELKFYNVVYMYIHVHAREFYSVHVCGCVEFQVHHVLNAYMYIVMMEKLCIIFVDNYTYTYTCIIFRDILIIELAYCIWAYQPVFIYMHLADTAIHGHMHENKGLIN